MKWKRCELAELRWMNLQPVIQSEVSQKEKNIYCILIHRASLVAQTVKNLLAMQETQV